MTSEHRNIKRYLNGQMNYSDRCGFESEMHSDPFLADAVEGFKSDPGALDDLPVLSHKSYWWVYGLISAILIIGFFALDFTNDRDDKYALSAVPAETEQAHKVDILYPAAPSTVFDKRLSYPQKATTGEEETGIETMHQGLKPMGPSAPALMRKKDWSKVGINLPEKTVRARYKIVYIADLKLVKSDFSVDKSSGLDLQQLTNHLPARYESPEFVETNIPETTDSETDFHKLWLEALTAFREGDYFSSLRSIDALEEKSAPSDVNIQFYRGLVFFELSRYTEAIAHFEKAERNIIPVFREEAMWYGALSMAANGDLASAKQRFQEIESAGGHYADRAQQRLNKNP